MKINKIIGLVITIFVFAVSMFPSVINAENYGAAGCGIGSLATKKNTKGNQIGASTLNSMFTNTFSISSGTAGCDKDEVSAREREQIKFVAANYTSLRQEMATGKGEKLEAFIDLMGCSSASSTFTNMTQKKHSELFNVKREESFKFVKLVKSNIKSDSNLAKSCQFKA